MRNPKNMRNPMEAENEITIRQFSSGTLVSLSVIKDFQCFM